MTLILDLYAMVGYDARQLWVDDWTGTMRAESLIRPDVTRPLSVDPQVWTSIFDVEPRIQRPRWTGPIQDQWDDLDRLTQYLGERRASIHGPASLVAIALLRDGMHPPDESLWRGAFAPTHPEAPANVWELLGLDVADRFLQSGLAHSANVDRPGFLDLRTEFCESLNDGHLFSNVAYACAYRDAIGRVVPEHAPFFVFGLWQVTKWTPCGTGLQ